MPIEVTRHDAWVLCMLAFTACAMAACSQSDGNGSGSDASVRDDATSAFDAMPSRDATPIWTSCNARTGAFVAPTFRQEIVAGLGTSAIVGDFAVMRRDAQRNPTIAYGFTPAGSSVPEIHYARRAANGVWSTERVATTNAHEPQTHGAIAGLGLAHVGGIPHIVYQGGDGDGVALTPFLTDLVLSAKSGASWSERTLVDTSGEAAGDCPGTQNTCNVGNVVGSNAAIAADPDGSGFTVVYRDTHFGFAADDFNLSDVEAYAEGGPFANSNVDPVSGGGSFSDVVYTASGRRLVAYDRGVGAGSMSSSLAGIWSASFDGSTWQRTRISTGRTSARLALASSSCATWLAISDVDANDLVVARTTDEGAHWETAVVDSAGKTGIHPSIAVDDDGAPIVAYAYCGPSTERDCPGTLGSKAEVRVARLEDGAWKIYTVDDGQGFGGVGFFTSVVVQGDGKIAVSFQDSRNKDLAFAKEE